MKGFTLIELIIYIAALSMLGASFAHALAFISTEDVRSRDVVVEAKELIDDEINDESYVTP
jgi:type II secretory pathway component PulJ